MEKAAPSSVDLGMMLLDTSPAESEGRSYATPAGRASIVLNVSGIFFSGGYDATQRHAIGWE